MARSAGDTWTHVMLQAYSAHNAWDSRTAAIAPQGNADLKGQPLGGCLSR